MTDTLKPEREVAAVRLKELLETEHWLGNYVSVLLSCWELTGDVDFETSRELLATEEREFRRDLEIARRMYKLHPTLVSEQRNGARASVPVD